jgi:hypothetical protein
LHFFEFKECKKTLTPLVSMATAVMNEIETHKELKCKILASGQRWNSNTTEHEGMEDSLRSKKTAQREPDTCAAV